MFLEARRAVAGAVLVGALMACAGCAPSPIDSSLWLQLDRQENVVYEVIGDPVLAPSGPKSFMDSLGSVAVYWDGASSPDFIDPAVGATVFYNVSERPDEFSDPVLEFDVLVTSGHRPDGSSGSSGWFSPSPSSVYTCYRLSVTFVADTVWNHSRSRDSGEDRLVCPQELVDALGSGAQYREPWEFDG
ncbi:MULTISPECIES: hypothetical protein [Microbacterium]|uniref:Uncharacterized protein n=1 Tax=Microbacterium wangchenii TaxID=2541726 RepID=A0ABX5SW99_9MICO|nr:MULTISPECIES: hypothetical protein [Microbacterium]MCK6065761.1 hypothetical protein [Microbacterium sp. EYE_512]QBR90077.1 hypothetical protein E4K62_16145 [Microbacterium wangchenii]